MARGRPARGGGGQGRQVTHSVPYAERNLIWELANDVWRPVKSPDFDAAQQAARKRGKNLPDPRSGRPVHAKPGKVTLPKDRHAQMADDLGYVPTRHVGVNNTPIFQKQGGDPEYISYDLDGHATANRDAARGQRGSVIPYDPGDPDRSAPPVSWKGADSPAKLGDRTSRDGTYIPTYDDSGNVSWRQPRPNK